MEPANFAELTSKIDSWDITAEQMLLQKMKIFTISYNEEFQQFCKNMDNFSNHIETVELEHLKAINQIKSISSEKFIENTIDKGEESESEIVANENNIVDNTLQITNIEKMRQTIDISLNCLNEINRKNKNTEEIEDDAVSVASSKILMVDKGAKVRLPFVIGTDEFKNDKAIGLNVAPLDDEEKPPESEEEEDSDVEEYLSGIKIDEKQKKKWKKIQKKKKKQKNKEKLKRNQESKKLKNPPKNEELEVKVPIENEGENQNDKNLNQNPPNSLVVSAPDPSKSGGTIPPPPPSPPQPPDIQTQANLPKTITVINPENKNIVNPYAQDAVNKVDPALNPEIINNQNQQQPQNGPLDFQAQLRNRLAQGNSNTQNINNINNVANANNNPTSVLDLIHTEADNKNPLAPVIRDKNIVLDRDKVKLNAFLGTASFLGEKYEDDEDDYDDLGTSLIRRKQTQLPAKNPQNNQNIEENQQINPNLEQNQQVNKNNVQPMMIMGMPRPQPQEQIQQQNIIHNETQMHNSNPQNQKLKPPQLQEQIPQEQINQQPQMQMPIPQQSIMQSNFNLFQNETKAIEIKKNRDLENAQKKLKNMFESDDEDEIDSKNIIDKTDEITQKVNLFAQKNPSNNEVKVSKLNVFNEEPKQNETKPKFSFFDEQSDNQPIKIENHNNITNTNINIIVGQEKPKVKLNLFDDLGKDVKKENEKNPVQKPKISFFDDENAEPVKDKINGENKIKNETATNSNPKPQNDNQQTSFLNSLKEKLATQNVNEIKKEPEPEHIKPKIEIQAQIEQKESTNEKPIENNQQHPKIIMPRPETDNKQKMSFFVDYPQKPQIEIKPPNLQDKEESPKLPIEIKPPNFLSKEEQHKPPIEIKPPNVLNKEEPKKEEEKVPKATAKKLNNKFAEMQNRLANKIGEKGGMMMMMGGPPPKKEEVKIEHDENVSAKGTGENNYEAVVKKTSVVKKKKPKRSVAFGGGTTIPIKNVEPKIETKPEIKIEEKKQEIKPKVDMFGVLEKN